MKFLPPFVYFFSIMVASLGQQTPFEKSNGKETATYFEAIAFYKDLDRISSKVLVKEMGPTDAGYPLHVVMVSSDSRFDPGSWHSQKKVVIMINNGIHPGEPDGIDASMMMVRDIVKGKITLPENVCLAIIPVYNIGGSLNRGKYSRANQQGPESYGFRGNSQNLDLNRDFTKCDSREARSFARIFHWLDPDILLDNHVSDGADYQYTMTLVTTQYDKLGVELGKWLKEKFEPAIFNQMKKEGWEMVPYVNWETSGPEKGMEQFFESPRYSSGYAALFQTLSFMPETHMLKPSADRVRATYFLEKVFIEQASVFAQQIKKQRMQLRESFTHATSFPLKWQLDSSVYDIISFNGYEQGFKPSNVTGKQRMFFDRNKPVTKPMKYFNKFKPLSSVTPPEFYIIPQGWHEVIDLLKLNGVKISALARDSVIEVEAYRIEDYKTFGPFEKHYLNYEVKVSTSIQKIAFRKNDVIIRVDQPVNRYIVEMLEPTAVDGFFAWNFFDAILQQKEYYSEYRWEDLAAQILNSDAVLQKKFSEKKLADTAFAGNPRAQLNFIYKNSHYYEPEHMRYPVFRKN